MPTDSQSAIVEIDIGGAWMHLRATEIRAVVRGLGRGSAESVVAAVLATDPRDRPLLWELVTRHLARGKTIGATAAEVGVDALRARPMLENFTLLTSGDAR